MDYLQVRCVSIFLSLVIFCNVDLNASYFFQEALDAKDRVISEKEESIKSLSENVSNEYAARLSLLEQSQVEMERLKSEHLKTIERVNNSKQEYCNQLQIVRQK